MDRHTVEGRESPCQLGQTQMYLLRQFFTRGGKGELAVDDPFRFHDGSPLRPGHGNIFAHQNVQFQNFSQIDGQQLQQFAVQIEIAQPPAVLRKFACFRQYLLHNWCDRDFGNTIQELLFIDCNFLSVKVISKEL